MKRTFPWSKGEDDSSSDDNGDSSSVDSDAEENAAEKSSKDKSSRVESGKQKKKGIDFEALSKHGYKGGLSVLKVPPPKESDELKDWSWSKGENARTKEKEETYQDRQKTKAALLEAEQLVHARTQKEKNLSFSQKEKRKRDMGQASRGKNYVEEEKRLLRENGIYSGLFIQAAALNRDHKRKAIRLRLVRSYEGPSFLRSTECLFHDSEGSFLHVQVPREVVEKFKNKFTQGRIYSLKNFMVLSNNMIYKTSPLEFMLKLHKDTEVFATQRSNFPNLRFRLRNFAECMAPGVVREDELIDLIGRVIEITQPRDVTLKGRASRLINFVIHDSEDRRLNVTVWDQHVDSVIPYFNSDSPEPIIVLIHLCRLMFNEAGEVKVSSSYSATQLYFDQETEVFQTFRASLKDFNTPLRSVSSTSRSSGATIQDFSSGERTMTTISEIYKQKQPGDFWLPLRVDYIEDNGDWSYNACLGKGKGCNKKLIPKYGQMYCTKCDRRFNQGSIRFKLLVRATDGVSDASFMIWDKECSEIFGVTAASLRNKYPEVGEVPSELEKIIGMCLVVQVAAKKENFERHDNALGVVQVIQDDALINKFCTHLQLNEGTKLALTDSQQEEEEWMAEIEEAQGSIEIPFDVDEQGEDESTPSSKQRVKRHLLDEFSTNKQKLKQPKIEED